MTTIASTLGGRIEQARSEMGLTVKQLATRIGVRTSTLAHWEQDRTEPRSNKLLTLAGILNVPLAWLLLGEAHAGDGVEPRRFAETSTIAQKLDRAISLQHDAAALLHEVTADVTRLQRQLDEEQDLAEWERAQEVVAT